MSPIRPLSSARGMNWSGRISSPDWALPAHQHFGADDPLTVAVHDGLEIGQQLRRPQPMRQLCVERSGVCPRCCTPPQRDNSEEQGGLQQVALALHYLIPRGGGVHAGVNGIGVFLESRGGNRGVRQVSGGVAAIYSPLASSLRHYPCAASPVYGYRSASTCIEWLTPRSRQARQWCSGAAHDQEGHIGPNKPS